MYKQQHGASFLTWVAGLGIVIFMFITGVKLVPLYLDFQAVRSLVDKVAADPAMQRASVQQVRRKVEDYLNINSLYGITPDRFTVVSVPGKNDVRALQVSYDVRKHWIANIDFLLTFEYQRELGKADGS